MRVTIQQPAAATNVEAKRQSTPRGGRKTEKGAALFSRHFILVTFNPRVRALPVHQTLAKRVSDFDVKCGVKSHRLKINI